MHGFPLAKRRFESKEKAQKARWELMPFIDFGGQSTSFQKN